MQWDNRKRGGVVAVVSLLIVALIAAVAWNQGVSAEDEFTNVSSTNSILRTVGKSMKTKPLFEFRRKKGPDWEYQYRTGQVFLKDFQRRRIVGMVYESEEQGRSPLKMYSLQRWTPIRKFVTSTKQYTRYLGVAGYVESSAAHGLVPLVELSKWDDSKERAYFMYLRQDSRAYNERIKYGWKLTQRVGYMEPPPNTVPIIRHRHFSGRFLGYVYQYRAGRQSVPNYTPSRKIGFLFNAWNPGRVPLKILAFSRDHSLQQFSLSDGEPGYTVYLGIAGYCSKTRKSNMVGLYEMRKRILRTLFVYVTTQEARNHFKGQKYRERFLCYIPKA